MSRFNAIALVVYRRDLVPDDPLHVVEVWPVAGLERRVGSPELTAKMASMWARYSEAPSHFRLEVV